MDFNHRVISFDYRFSDLEDEIILYIQKNKEEVSTSKIKDLAEKFYTVPNTVSRLCNKLGYHGFLELKRALKAELEEKEEAAEIETKTEIIMKNLVSIDEQREKEIVKVLKQAAQVNFFSISSTAHAARMIVDGFSLVDDKFHFYAYEHEIKHRIRIAQDEVFFFVSLTGESKNLVSLAREAKKRKQPLISLTTLSKNSLVQVSDFQLFCYSPKQTDTPVDILDKVPLLITMDRLLQRYTNN